jgi:hypothetical protein
MMRMGDMLFPGTPQSQYPSVAAHLRLAVEEIERDGWATLPAQLPLQVCADLRAAVAGLLASEAAELGGPENLARIGDEGVSRSPFLRDSRFVEPAALPDVLAIARHFLGPVVQMNLQRVVVNVPGLAHGAGVWHRDHSYQDFTTSRPVSLTALAMLDGSRPGNGAPSLLPGSHRFERFPTFEYARARAIRAICAPGDVLLIDSAIFHRTEPNPGPEPRHTVVTIYTVPLIRQNVDYPRRLAGKWSDDPVLGPLMGYATAMPASDLDYRRAKLERGRRVARDRSVAPDPIPAKDT